MPNQILKSLIIFLILSALGLLGTRYLGLKFQDNNYWDHRGIFFLIFIGLFPRLTLLFSSVASGGLIWWLGWIFAPRILVAILATLSYWNQNSILVVIAWLVAVSGESSEKTVIINRRVHYSGRGRRQQTLGDGEIIDVTPNKPAN